MSNIFSDIFEAIRFLRQEKGTSEKQILTFVAERMGKSLNIAGFLKITRALEKLVDDGLLLKKGKRYILPWQRNGNGCPESQDKGGDEEEEDDEDEDEDEDDDDEDDDDDGDDDCPNEEENAAGDKANGKSNGNAKPEMEGGNETGGNGNKDQCQMDEDIPLRRQDNSEWNFTSVNNKLKKYIKSELNPMQSFSRSKKYKQRKLRHQLCDEIYDQELRSPSPSRKNSDMMMELEDFLSESEGEAQLNHSDLTFGYGFDGITTCHYRSPNGSPPPNTPGVHLERKESCCSDIPKPSESIKTEPAVLIKREANDERRESQDRAKEGSIKRRAGDGPEENIDMGRLIKTEASIEDANNIKTISLCSFCKKKKME